MYYVCDAVSFASHVNVKGCAILKIKACADDRLLRPNSDPDAIWNEFACMKVGKDYKWINPWNPDILPFNKKSAFNYASADGTLELKIQKFNNDLIAMAFHQDSDLYFFYRIRQLTSKETDTIIKLYKQYRSKYLSISKKLSNIKV